MITKYPKSPFEPKSDIFKKILDYLPHSHILTIKYVDKAFNETIKDYKLFRGYTLVFDCGRRTSFIGGRGSKGPMLGRDGQYIFKSNEVQFKDKNKEIYIATGYKPLKSQYVKQALIGLSQTSLNKVQFKSYKITEYNGNSLPPSANVSPLDGGIWESFHGANINGLGAISEMKGDHANNTQNGKKSNGNHKLNKPPESKSSGSRKRFDSDLSQRSYSAKTPNDSIQRLTISSSLTSSASSSSSSRSSSSRPSDSSTISTAIMELPLPSTQHSDNSRSSKRISSAIFHGQDSKDVAFEQLLEILS